MERFKDIVSWNTQGTSASNLDPLETPGETAAESSSSTSLAASGIAQTRFSPIVDTSLSTTSSFTAHTSHSTFDSVYGNKYDFPKHALSKEVVEEKTIEGKFCISKFPKFAMQLYTSLGILNRSKSKAINKASQAVAQFYGNYLRYEGGLTDEERLDRPIEFPDKEIVDKFEKRVFKRISNTLIERASIDIFLTKNKDPIRAILKKYKISINFFPSNMQTFVGVASNGCQILIQRPQYLK